MNVWQIDADESQDLLRELKIYGIPTILGYQNGQEVVRYVGVKPRNEIQLMFESLSAGYVPKRAVLSNWDRTLRLAAGALVTKAGMGKP